MRRVRTLNKDGEGMGWEWDGRGRLASQQRVPLCSSFGSRRRVAGFVVGL